MVAGAYSTPAEPSSAVPEAAGSATPAGSSDAACFPDGSSTGSPLSLTLPAPPTASAGGACAAANFQYFA